MCIPFANCLDLSENIVRLNCFEYLENVLWNYGYLIIIIMLLFTGC